MYKISYNPQSTIKKCTKLAFAIKEKIFNYKLQLQILFTLFFIVLLCFFFNFNVFSQVLIFVTQQITIVLEKKNKFMPSF